MDVELTKPGNAVIDRREIDLSAKSFKVTTEELGDIATTSSGAAFQRLALQPAGMPVLGRKKTFEIKWDRDGRSRFVDLEKIESKPGEHTLILWRRETLCYLGDGGLSTFSLPNRWSLALDHVAAPPTAPAEQFAPQVQIGFDGALLTPASVDDATFDGGSPPAGSVWFRLQGSQFKLPTPPAPGEDVYVRIVPEYVVLRQQPGEKVLDLFNLEDNVTRFREV